MFSFSVISVLVDHNKMSSDTESVTAELEAHKIYVQVQEELLQGMKSRPFYERVYDEFLEYLKNLSMSVVYISSVIMERYRPSTLQA